MGNCFAGDRGLVHPAAALPLLPAPGGSSRIKVRMTVAEFKEVVARAQSRSRDPGAAVGALIMEGVRKGRWAAVRVCDAGGRGSGGGGGGGHGRNAGGAEPLETIHED